MSIPSAPVTGFGIAFMLLATACNAFAAQPDSAQPMVTAAGEGRLDAIRAMVSTGADVNTMSPGFTPLCAASAGGHVEVAGYLIAHGAQVNTTNASGYTPLYWAVTCDHKDMVSLLLEKGAAVNLVSLEGSLVAIARSPEMLDLLLDRGAVVNSEGDKRPPLHAAVYGGRLEMAKALLAHGARPNATNAWGATPLHEAARSENPSAAMALLLITNGANVNATDGNGGTPLHTAVKGFTGCMDGLMPFWVKNRIVKERLNVAEVLLDHGADINALDHEGRTPLALAQAERNSAASKFLIRHGASPGIGREKKIR